MQTKDTKTYVQCMEKVKQRIAVVRWLIKDDPLGAQRSMLTTELMFVQFRKILELIAFASLTANKDKYAAAYKDFGEHWKAKDMLACIEKLNADFYPVPVTLIGKDNQGQVQLKRRLGGYLTRQDFKKLYDASSEVMHMRNPHSTKDPVTKIPYSELTYADRIQNLVSRHLIQMVDRRTLWLVTVPGSGNVEMIKTEIAPS